MPKFGKVSVISFGASGLGGMFTAGEGSGLTDASASGGGSDAHWWQDDGDEARGRAREIVHMCLKAGVNLIDTSHWYGQGRSERLLGHALSDVPRAAYYITTKIGRYEKDALGMFDFSYEKTYQAALDSLKRLRLDCVDSMQIHDPEFCPSVDLLLEQTLPALQKLKEEGKVKASEQERDADSARLGSEGLIAERIDEKLPYIDSGYVDESQPDIMGGLKKLFGGDGK